MIGVVARKRLRVGVAGPKGLGGFLGRLGGRAGSGLVGASGLEDGWAAVAAVVARAQVTRRTERRLMSVVLKRSAQGQRAGRWRVNRRAEWVIRPGTLK